MQKKGLKWRVETLSTSVMHAFQICFTPLALRAVSFYMKDVHVHHEWAAGKAIALVYSCAGTEGMVQAKKLQRVWTMMHSSTIVCEECMLCLVPRGCPYGYTIAPLLQTVVQEDCQQRG